MVNTKTANPQKGTIMARKPSTVISQITVAQLNPGDILVGRNSRTEYLVRDVKRTNHHHTLTVVEMTESGDATDWNVTSDMLVRVRDEQPCKCDGSGKHYGPGHFENGAFTGTISVCYGCKGKGYMNRGDIIRNHIYWSQYARA